ncbi:MAG: LysR family transcriptional regulator [Pseudomonadales bacterium]|uniref:Transcriptional regulatory protein n=1 Tax=Oleiphilus messinensis TaxID=141451 RepID=A0A1Y0IF71_9GAMM|nr:LysR family transcriptional regulator [Oleiphilus messinensis]ARU58023.1 transcriptional regulatory protein [Oleiphilus messinensis]MCG8609641.1 LysR family transcriptional regulator [Pseudomonadales bacterium]
MDLKALKYFIATVEEGSISAAAQRLYIAQPSISMALAKLEDSLGAQLLIRGKKGVTPTPAGQSLYQQALGLVQHAQSIKNSFTDEGQGAALTISVAPSIAFHYLGRVLTVIRGRIPNRSIHILRANGSANALKENQIEARSADFRLLPESDTQPEDVFVPLWSERYQLIVPQDHALAYQSRIKFTDLKGQRLIARTFCERNEELKAFLLSLKIEVDIVAEVDNEEWALMLVEQGIGSAILPLPDPVDSSRRFVSHTIDHWLPGESLKRRIGVAMDYQKLAVNSYRQLLDELKNQLHPIEG